MMVLKHLTIPAVTRVLRPFYCRLQELLPTTTKPGSTPESKYFLIVEASGHTLLSNYVPDTNWTQFVLKNCKLIHLMVSILRLKFASWSVREYAHLSGLELADCSEGTDTGVIDALIGSGFYWKFVTVEVCHGSVVL